MEEGEFEWVIRKLEGQFGQQTAKRSTNPAKPSRSDLHEILIPRQLSRHKINSLGDSKREHFVAVGLSEIDLSLGTPIRCALVRLFLPKSIEERWALVDVILEAFDWARPSRQTDSMEAFYRWVASCHLLLVL